MGLYSVTDGRSGTITQKSAMEACRVVSEMLRERARKLVIIDPDGVVIGPDELAARAVNEKDF